MRALWAISWGDQSDGPLTRSMSPYCEMPPPDDDAAMTVDLPQHRVENSPPTLSKSDVDPVGGRRHRQLARDVARLVVDRRVDLQLLEQKGAPGRRHQQSLRRERPEYAPTWRAIAPTAPAAAETTIVSPGCATPMSVTPKYAAYPSRSQSAKE